MVGSKERLGIRRGRKNGNLSAQAGRKKRAGLTSAAVPIGMWKGAVFTDMVRSKKAEPRTQRRKPFEDLAFPRQSCQAGNDREHTLILR